MTEIVAPSGEQHEISSAGQRAVVVEVGGGIRSYEVAGRAVLDPYDRAAPADGGRGQTLVPWPNRVRDGKWSWQGASQQLSLTEPEAHHAIHGLVRWLPWRLVERTAQTVTLRTPVVPQPGYPGTLTVTNLWSVGDDGLAVTTTIDNIGAAPIPVAAGFHPYLAVGDSTVDAATLRLPAATRLVVDDRQIPTGRAPVAGTAYDFETGRLIGDQQIDAGFTDLRRDVDGRARVVLTAADGVTTTLWADESYDYLEVFTGDTLSDRSRRRQGLAVEPMSAPPNALASGEGLVVLDPGGSWSGSWGIEPG